MNCTYCGARLPDSARYCAACGRLLTPSAEGAAPAPAAPVRAPVAPAPLESPALDNGHGTAGGVLTSNASTYSPETGDDRPSLRVDSPPPTVRGSYGHAWRRLKAHFWPLLRVSLAWGAISLVQWLPDLFRGTADASPADMAVAQAITLALVPLGYGGSLAFLSAARGDRPRVADLFVPYRQALFASVASVVLIWLAALAAILVLAVPVSIAGFVLAAAFGQAIAAASVPEPLIATGITAGALLLAVPSIVVGIRLSFVPYFVVDGRLGPVQALRASWQRTAGYGWTILGVWLLGIPMVLLGLAALVVGVIPALMLIYLAHASLFVAIPARQQAP